MPVQNSVQALRYFFRNRYYRSFICMSVQKSVQVVRYFFRNYIICTAPVQMFVQMPVQISVQAVRYLFRKGPGFVVRK